MTQQTNILPFERTHRITRHDSPPPKPRRERFILAEFDACGELHLSWEGISPAQISYLAAVLLREAVDVGEGGF